MKFLFVQTFFCTSGGYPCYQDALLSPCGMMLQRDNGGSDDVHEITCGTNCDANCNDGKWWPKPTESQLQQPSIPHPKS